MKAINSLQSATLRKIWRKEVLKQCPTDHVVILKKITVNPDEYPAICGILEPDGFGFYWIVAERIFEGWGET